jgi:hypothetical protein
MRDPIIDDAEIGRLIAVQKLLPDDWERALRARSKKDFAHKKASLEIQTPDGGFTIIIRENTINTLSFSVILACTRPNGSFFRLRRYNGRHGEHLNHLERQIVTGCHIHQATARYQIAGYREDAFAVASTDFSDTASALQLMFSQCTFKIPDVITQTEGPQLTLLPVKKD